MKINSTNFGLIKQMATQYITMTKLGVTPKKGGVKSLNTAPAASNTATSTTSVALKPLISTCLFNAFSIKNNLHKFSLKVELRVRDKIKNSQEYPDYCIYIISGSSHLVKSILFS